MPMYRNTVCLDGRLVPCRDSKVDVTLYRTRRDITTAKPGNVRECADAQCGIRERKKFPHAFHGIVVFPSVAYVIDKVDADGEPAHLIRYYRTKSERKDIANFDKHGKDAIGPRQITLKAVPAARRLGANAGRPHHPKPAKAGPRKKPLLRHVRRRGIARRFLMANGGVAVV